MTTNGDGYSTLHVLKGKTTKKSIPIFGTIAQLVEQRTENPCVPGSIPGGTTEQCSLTCWKIKTVHQSSWSGRRPVTAEITGSSPVWTAKIK